MLFTNEIKNELIGLAEILEIDGDELGQAIVVWRRFPRPVHAVIVVQNVLLPVDRDSKYARLAPRIALVQ